MIKHEQRRKFSRIGLNAELTKSILNIKHILKKIEEMKLNVRIEFNNPTLFLDSGKNLISPMLVPNPAILETSAIDDRTAEARPICAVAYSLLVIHQNTNPIKLGIKLIPKIKTAFAMSGCLIVLKVFLKSINVGRVIISTAFKNCYLSPDAVRIGKVLRTPRFCCLKGCQTRRYLRT